MTIPSRPGKGRRAADPPRDLSVLTRINATKLSLDDLQITSFTTAESVESVGPAPATGPQGPCWICRPSDPGVPTCDRTCAVDSYCHC